MISNIPTMGTVVDVAWDFLNVTWNPLTFTEIFDYYSKGITGTLVLKVTTVYADVNKAQLISVTKTGYGR